MKHAFALLVLTLTGCGALAPGGWVAAHQVQIAGVAAVAGATAAVTSTAVNTVTLVNEVKKEKQ